MTRGKFITLEGPEGGGKTTQAARLVERLRAAGREVLPVREPGGTPTGELIRKVLQHDHTGEPLTPETEVLLFEASRAQLVGRVIRPALERGAWVVADRFFDSTTAYQGYGRGLDVETLLTLNALAAGDCAPDLTLLLDVPLAAGFGRLAARQRVSGDGPDRMEREAQDFHARVREGFLALARRWPERICVIDATQAVDAVERDIWRCVCDAGGI